jgi:cytosine/adenosine deaminase-related metal-dependent hydrolase
MDAGRGWSTERVDVEIDAGRIASVRPTGATPAAARRIIDGRERLLVPGFINTHTHSPANVLKGIGDGAGHREFMWINQADTAGRSADEIRLSALVGAIEHLRNGTTAVIDHFPEQGFKAADVDALASAYSQAGLRACMALRIFDATYDDILPAAGFPKDAGVPNPLDPPAAVGGRRAVAFHGPLGPGLSGPVCAPRWLARHADDYAGVRAARAAVGR